LTATGAVMGSPSYMAPEQAAARLGDVGPATDVYSLGAIFYQLLTGQPPHRGKTAMETVLKVIEEEPVSPTKLKADVPPDLAIICLKCLEKAPERRYSSARFLAEDLGRFIEGEPIQAKPAGAPRKLWSWALRHPWAISGSASLVILGLGLSTYGLWQKTQYLAWLAAHPGQIPVNYWPVLVDRELPVSTRLILVTIWLTTISCLINLLLRNLARVRLQGPRLAFYSAMALTFIGSCFYVIAKAVKICVWVDAPIVVTGLIILYLQPFLWSGLQVLWLCIRALLQGQSGVEPPQDFFSITPLAPAELGGPFSIRNSWRAYATRSRAVGLDTLELLRTFGFVGPMLTVWVALVLVSWWRAPHQMAPWFVSAFWTAIFAHFVAGLINPRWIVRRAMLNRSTPNGYRFGCAVAVVAGGATYAVLWVIPHSSGPTESSLAGLVAGVLLVLVRRNALRRETDAEKSCPPS
jgi:hypothetical protein